jgi:hypothetical protein
MPQQIRDEPRASPVGLVHRYAVLAGGRREHLLPGLLRRDEHAPLGRHRLGQAFLEHRGRPSQVPGVDVDQFVLVERQRALDHRSGRAGVGAPRAVPVGVEIVLVAELVVVDDPARPGQSEIGVHPGHVIFQGGDDAFASRVVVRARVIAEVLAGPQAIVREIHRISAPRHDQRQRQRRRHRSQHDRRLH